MKLLYRWVMQLLGRHEGGPARALFNQQDQRRQHVMLWIQVLIGCALLVVGIVHTIGEFTYAAEHSGIPNVPDYETSRGDYILMFVPILVGLFVTIRALLNLAGFKGFVAMRYLLVARTKVTRRTRQAIFVGLVAWCALYVFVDPPGLGGINDLLTGRASVGIGVLVAIKASVQVFVVVVTFWGVLRYSKPAMIVFVIGLVIGMTSLICNALIDRNKLPFLSLDPDTARRMLQVFGVVALVGVGLSFLATFFGVLRGFFTFFTTVPIGGVWIGTSALVMVLAVMSGFETDLRQKILGSNAHIQVTKDDGTDFVDWRAVKAKIDKIPGVVASTPYAASEVVIAANNNGMNVIIKGIDPATVGTVTDLVSDLDDKNSIKELDAKQIDRIDRTVKQTPRPTPQNGKDELPPDMPTGADPIDFSGKGPETEKKDEKKNDEKLPNGPGATKGDPPKDDAAIRTMKFDRDGKRIDDPDPQQSEPRDDDDYGGDARTIQQGDLYAEIPPTELLQWMTGTDGLPADLDLGRHSARTGIIRISDEPSLQMRTAALPGILVGRELVKQTHLMTGQEVRVISPLSDPSNPDATGTPIPFHRDYRVAGVFYTGMYEYDLKYVYVTLDSLQAFLDRGDAVDGIEVRIKDADDTARYVPDLDRPEISPGLIREALGPGYRVVDWRELNRSLFSALKLEKIAMFLVLGIVILVASFSIVGNLIMVVVEKAREIALLKTLGASDVGVMSMFAIQGLLIGLIGTLLGVASGLAACWAGKRWGLPLNPDVYYIDQLPIHVDPMSVAAAAAAGILISIAATLYPAFLAARVRPAAGMRH